MRSIKHIKDKTIKQLRETTIYKQMIPSEKHKFKYEKFIENAVSNFKLSIPVNMDKDRVNNIVKNYTFYMETFFDDEAVAYDKRYRNIEDKDTYLNFMLEKIYFDLYKNQEKILNREQDDHVFNAGGFLVCL